MYPVESEMKQQMSNVKKYKDVIREEKDLTKLVGTESNFDIDAALRLTVAYYNGWKGLESHLIDRISIDDEEFRRHLQADIVQDRMSPILAVGIKNFPNEAGYFMLWELSISDDSAAKRIIPIFINEEFVLRPMAGKRIMDVFLDANSSLTIHTVSNIGEQEYEKLGKISMDFAYEAFVNLKEKQIKKNQEHYNKYMYALRLRTEAVEHIGIENIRKARLARLQKEKVTIEEEYKDGQRLYPDFKLELLVRLEE